MKDLVPADDRRKEGQGWLLLASTILLFPALFFLCVFAPIWLGWTSRW